MWNQENIKRWKDKLEAGQQGGGQARVEKQHAQGKLTARERLELLFDPGSFVEINTLVEPPKKAEYWGKEPTPGDGVIVGYGMIHQRPVYASSQDFTVSGGTLGEYHSNKICQIMDMALSARAPYISINDSGGARIEEGICSLNGYSGIFYRNTMASGVIPQISVILGPCAGGACYSPAISDFIFMTEQNSRMFITGPAVVQSVTGETTTAEELGGAKVHEETSGVAHFVYPDEPACLSGVRELLSYLPQNNSESPAILPGTPVDESEQIESIVPDNMRKAYDVHRVIDTFLDRDSFFEIQKEYAKNIVAGFGRMDGEVIGVVANQPSVAAGSLDVNASDKAARFVRFCDCFGIPIVTLVDVPGYLPGRTQEHAGIIRHGAKLLYAFAEATVPKISLIMRKAYGGAYIAMNSKNMGADFVFAWPIAETAVMGAEGAVDILYRSELKTAENPDRLREERTREYEAKYLNPYIAAANGYIDEIIAPEETRVRIRQALSALKNKKKTGISKKHGNIPL